MMRMAVVFGHDTSDTFPIHIAITATTMEACANQSSPINRSTTIRARCHRFRATGHGGAHPGIATAAVLGEETE
jgi:hypothetical protein